MRRAFWIIASVSLIYLAVDPARGDDLTSKFGVGFNWGFQRYRGEHVFDSQTIWRDYEFFVRYGLTSDLSVMFNGSLVDLEGADAFKTEITPLMELRLLFSSFPEKKINPFIYIGGGGLAFSPKDAGGKKLPVLGNWRDWKAVVSTGIGVEYFVKNYFAVNGCLDGHLAFTDQLEGMPSGDWDDGFWGLKVGFTFYFGDKKREPQAPEQQPTFESSPPETQPEITQQQTVSDRTELTPVQLDTVIETGGDKVVPEESLEEGEPEAKEFVPKHVGDVRILRGVNFDFNSNRLTRVSMDSLDVLAEALLRNPLIELEIRGHTDNRGDPLYNLDLSQRRADVVRDYLVAVGIEIRRLKAVSFGESNPIAPNDTSTGRALNRRVEIVRTR